MYINRGDLVAKIIKSDSTRKRPTTVSPEKTMGCDHKQVIAYTVYRTVHCSICGAELDPFDVLVDMLKAYVPSDTNDLEEKRLHREMEKRSEKKFKKDKPSQE